MSGGRALASERLYEPVADIATGGMGRVELVVRREGSFARVYAMKRLRPELSNDPEIRKMFLEEARIAGLIRHPNVVPVLDVGEDELGPYLVMDYVEGVAAWKPLVAARARGERLSVPFCVEVARQSAHGLAAAHELEGAGGRQLCVVHRDVSPQNILLGFDGLVRVTDFGVARALDKCIDEEGVIKGKIGYMSPEHIEGRPLDARSDLFSLGIVLYELLTASRLYPGAQAEAFRKIRYEVAPDVRTLVPDMPDELADLVAELLAKTPEARPAAAGRVAERLDRIAVELREGGEDVPFSGLLRRDFADERQRQRALIGEALEQTRAEIALLDDSGRTWGRDDPVTVRARPALPAGSDNEPVTVVEDVRPRPARLWPLGFAIAASLFGALLLSSYLAVSWMGERGEPSVAGASTPDACSDSAGCRAALGAPFFCDPGTRRCESPVSAACPEVFPGGRMAPDAIVLGTILDRSTPNQLSRERAARLAVAGINRAGGIDGRAVLLVHCDTSVADATEAVGRLVKAGVPAIIGPSSSSDTAAVFSSHAADGVLVISPSATATQLGDLHASSAGLLWRTAPPDSLQASVIMSMLRAPPAARTIVVVRRSNDVYAQSLSVILQESAAAAGLTVARSQVFADATGIEDAARTAAAASPDAVVFVSSLVGDAAAFLDAASALRGYDGATIYLPDAAANEDLLALTTTGSSRFGQVRATRPAAPSTIVTSEFASEYMSAYGGEDPLQFSFTAHAYDATALVLLGCGYALGGGGALSGARIGRGIELMSEGASEHRLLRANFLGIISALRSEAPDVNVVGASGPLDFDASTGELASAAYDVLGINGAPPRYELLDTVRAPL